MYILTVMYFLFVWSMFCLIYFGACKKNEFSSVDILMNSWWICWQHRNGPHLWNYECLGYSNIFDGVSQCWPSLISKDNVDQIDLIRSSKQTLLLRLNNFDIYIYTIHKYLYFLPHILKENVIKISIKHNFLKWKSKLKKPRIWTHMKRQPYESCSDFIWTLSYKISQSGERKHARRSNPMRIQLRILFNNIQANPELLNWSEPSKRAPKHCSTCIERSIRYDVQRKTEKTIQ